VRVSPEGGCASRRVRARVGPNYVPPVNSRRRHLQHMAIWLHCGPGRAPGPVHFGGVDRHAVHAAWVSIRALARIPGVCKGYSRPKGVRDLAGKPGPAFLNCFV